MSDVAGYTRHLEDLANARASRQSTAERCADYLAHHLRYGRAFLLGSKGEERSRRRSTRAGFHPYSAIPIAAHETVIAVGVPGNA